MAASPVFESNPHTGDGANRNGWPIPEGEIPTQAASNGASAQVVGLGIGFVQAPTNGVRIDHRVRQSLPY